MTRSNFLSLEDRRERLACVATAGGSWRCTAGKCAFTVGLRQVLFEIAQVLYLDDDTLRGWHKQYLAEGWDAVAYHGWRGGQSRRPVASR